MGESRPEDQNRHDAAEWRPSSRTSRARCVRIRARGTARPGGGSWRQSWNSGPPPVESHGAGNAIRDLLALDIDVATLLPTDGSSEGFDNIAEALGVSPSLIQGYVSAAMKISRQAVGDRTLGPYQVTYAAPAGLSHDRHIEGLPLGTRGGMLIRHTFPLDAEHEFTVTGGGLEVEFLAGPSSMSPSTAKIDVANPRKFTVPVLAGPHAIGIALVDRQRSAGVDEVFSTSGRMPSSRILAASRTCSSRGRSNRPEPAIPQAGAEFSFAGDTERRTSLRDQDPVDARAPGISRTGHRR